MAPKKNRPKKGSKRSNADTSGSTSEATYNTADTGTTSAQDAAGPSLDLSSTLSSMTLGPKILIGTRVKYDDVFCPTPKCDARHSALVPSAVIMDGSGHLSAGDRVCIDSLIAGMRNSEMMYTYDTSQYQTFIKMFQDSKKESTARRLLSFKVSKRVEELLQHTHGSTLSVGEMTDADWLEIDTRRSGGTWEGKKRAYLIRPLMNTVESETCTDTQVGAIGARARAAVTAAPASGATTE